MYNLVDDDVHIIGISTDGLGMGVTLSPCITVISSCYVNRCLEQNVISAILNSRNGVYQEGCRVARTRPGRHILLRQHSKLPETDRPEIHTACLHKLVLRLVRAEEWNSRSEILWVENEEPSEMRLMQSFNFLVELGCIKVWGGNWSPWLTQNGDRVLQLPTGVENSLLFIHAQKDRYFRHILAGVAFLDAAEGSHIDDKKMDKPPELYFVLGRRLTQGHARYSASPMWLGRPHTRRTWQSWNPRPQM